MLSNGANRSFRTALFLLALDDHDGPMSVEEMSEYQDIPADWVLSWAHPGKRRGWITQRRINKRVHYEITALGRKAAQAYRECDDWCEGAVKLDCTQEVEP